MARCMLLLRLPWRMLQGNGCLPLRANGMDISRLKTLFAYDNWANCETLDSLRRVASPPTRALEVMGHIVGCQWLWIGRLKHEPEPAVVWPRLDIEQCAKQLGEIVVTWADYLSALTASAHYEQVVYTNSKGESWTSSVEDVLTHVIIHSGYHRGQIAMLLGRAGYEPAYTDFVHCIRQQKIKISPT